MDDTGVVTANTVTNAATATRNPLLPPLMLLHLLKPPLLLVSSMMNSRSVSSTKSSKSESPNMADTGVAMANTVTNAATDTGNPLLPLLLMLLHPQKLPLLLVNTMKLS